MKKIIAVLTLLLAFTISANAQEKKAATPAQEKNAATKDAAKKDAAALTEYLGLTQTQQADFARLFEMKQQTLNDRAASEDQKKEMKKVVEMKIRASLTPEQTQKLEKNPELLKRLVE